MIKKPSLPSVPEYPNPPKLQLKEAPTPKKFKKAEEQNKKSEPPPPPKPSPFVKRPKPGPEAYNYTYEFSKGAITLYEHGQPETRLKFTGGVTEERAVELFIQGHKNEYPYIETMKKA